MTTDDRNRPMSQLDAIRIATAKWGVAPRTEYANGGKLCIISDLSRRTSWSDTRQGRGRTWEEALQDAGLL